jgi:alkyl hydroperoxide reductase subunit AhpF
MSILKIYGGRVLQAALAEMVRPVQVIYEVVDRPEPDTVQALADLTNLTTNLSVDLQQQPSGQVDRLFVQTENGGTLVFVGSPMGTELAALISAIIVVGRGTSGLTDATRQLLAALPGPLHLTVFTTPT